MSSRGTRLSSLVARLRSLSSGNRARAPATATSSERQNTAHGSRPALWPLWIVVGVGAAIAAEELMFARQSAEQNREARPARASDPVGDLGKAPCPSGTLPDQGVCIPVPAPEAAESDALEVGLELLPGRPSDYARYLTPISGHAAAANPDGGSLVRARAGAEVRALRLESQLGPTRWASLQSADPALLTLHRVQRGSSQRTYVLVYRGVDFLAPSTWTDIPDGGVIAHVGAASEPAGLRLRVRQLRRGAEGEPPLGDRLLRDSTSLECDPRNILPLTPG